MAARRTFGHVPGQAIRSLYPDRRSLCDAHLHRPLQAGIWGGKDGAESVVVSGGYRDDQDLGNEIIYTGHGGNNPSTHRQIADQVLEGGNLGLAVSANEGHPVRVIRGSGGDPEQSPASGYRYDGLFRVAEYWHEVGVDGFRIWRFRLEQLADQAADASTAEAVTSGTHDLGGSDAPRRAISTVQRVVRSSKIADRVKAQHKHVCQMCGSTLVTPAGPYAEGAHIRALGRPHNGPDVSSNLLCLCPNDHVLFDSGGLVIAEDLSIVLADGTIRGRLRTVDSHEIDASHLAYHRGVHGR